MHEHAERRAQLAKMSSLHLRQLVIRYVHPLADDDDRADALMALDELTSRARAHAYNSAATDHCATGTDWPEGSIGGAYAELRTALERFGQLVAVHYGTLNRQPERSRLAHEIATRVGRPAGGHMAAKHRPREDAVVDAIDATLRARRRKRILAGQTPPWWQNNHGSEFGRAGIPDLTGAHCGQHFAIEIKAPGGRPTPRQRIELRWLQRAGSLAIVADDAERVRELLDSIEAQAGAVPAGLRSI